jgi:hypothetical protein
LDAAILGIMGILKTIKKNAPSIKHIIITSSSAAIFDLPRGLYPGHIYSEQDWNPVTLEQAYQNSADGYRASKTYAEKAA